MHKTFKVLSILLLILFSSSIIYASGPDDEDTYGDTVEVVKYQVSMKKAEAYYTTGDYAEQWYTVIENSSGVPLNIASATAGEEVGNFFSGATLPLGHISQIRQTIMGSFLVKAIVSQDGTTYYSKSDGTASTNSADYAECTIPFQMPDGSTPAEMTSDPTDVSIDVNAGQTVTMKVTFNLLSANTGGTTGGIGMRMAPGPDGEWVIATRQPNVSQEISYQ